MTTLAHQTVLVTGANRGMGAAYVAQLLERGVAKVYAAARDPRSVVADDPRVVPLELDVTDPESVRRAAAAAPDVTVVVNNAGLAAPTSVLADDPAGLRRELEVNLLGPLAVTSAFVEGVVAAGGAIVNVASALSWAALGQSYGVSKAALWSATDSMRFELAPRGVQVVGVYVGYVDTEMVSGVDAPKADPADVVRQVLDGVEAGALEVLADETSRGVRAGLHLPIEEQFPQLVAS
ncbi:SDR family oxidoreductase [Nocardioides lianchengensis]|uniref:Short-chain dehydrogenase n=1 Tax=Nocardioides lianchengensis TaxID=1045774 RepID=A0A1G7C439_9ACTN|nr:SDR family oxidoreductase [Nocardioides lianchengensis]NYG09358.1 NAD(P)-dependent dehydrogenase (short-subunit alcohol dehydrogenase family) [Nocardioides lianchengensis]SDE34071.1 Short-chain dehydrogenase [Nocardioides lianchengensis]